MEGNKNGKNSKNKKHSFYFLRSPSFSHEEEDYHTTLLSWPFRPLYSYHHQPGALPQAGFKIDFQAE